MSVATDIAEAVKDALNAAPVETFSVEFTARRKYLPRVELEAMGDDLFVTVAVKSDDRALVSRGGNVARDVPVDVGVQKKLAAGTNPDLEDANPEIDALVTLVEEIADYLSPGKRLGNGVALRTTVDPIYSVDHLDQMSVFMSVVTVLTRVP